MFLIIYNKTTKKIVNYRHDLSSEPNTAEYYFNLYLKDNEIINNNLNFIEILFKKEFNNIEIGNHTFNEITGEIEADENYISPIQTITE